MRDNLGKKGRKPVVISLTKKETESRRMSPRRLKQAVEAIRRDGYVVIENAVPMSRSICSGRRWIRIPGS